MMAELFGKDSGCARGKGGSMHLVDTGAGVLGSSAVVGTTMPVAMGYAFALKREGKGRVVAAFFGDGATEEGVLWESLNFAPLHKLPILFVCENNDYAIHKPIKKRWAVRDLVAKVRAFGLPADRIEDGDVLAIRAATVAAVEPMRTGAGGASFLECMTYRWREHVGPNADFDSGYRSRSELEPWQAADQVARLAGMIAPRARRRIEDEVEREIARRHQLRRAQSLPAVERVEHACLLLTAVRRTATPRPSRGACCATSMRCARPWRRRWTSIRACSSSAWMSTTTSASRAPPPACWSASAPSGCSRRRCRRTP